MKVGLGELSFISDLVSLAGTFGRLSTLRDLTGSGSLEPALGDSDGRFFILCFPLLHDVLWISSGAGASLEKGDFQIEIGQIHDSPLRKADKINV